MTIGAPLSRFAAQKPDATALVCDDEVITWRDLDETVEAFALAIDERAGAGRSVALVMKNAPAMLACFLACARTGREAAVLDPAWPAARRREALDAISPSLVITMEPGGAGETMFVDARAPLPRAAVATARPAVDPALPFYVGFTSGSTGKPKAYRRSHHSWLRSFEGDRIEFGVTGEDVVLAPGSLTHSLFLYAAVHGLQIGAKVLLSRTFHPSRALRMAAQHAATVAYAAPTQWRLLLDSAQGRLPHLRWALSSGAKWFPQCDADIARVAPNARFAEFFGSSELSFVAVRKTGDGCPPDSVGRAFAGVRISIRDGDGKPVQPGGVGRIFVSSPYLFDGYVGPHDRIERIEDEMSIGDMGCLDPSGFLRLAGRADRMIVTSGKNVFAEEVEQALEGASGVRAAAVLGVPDELRGQRLVALLLPEDNCALQRSELVKSLRAKLPRYFVPHTLALVEHWRWTRSGKTDFNAMRAVWDAGAWTELR